MTISLSIICFGMCFIGAFIYISVTQLAKDMRFAFEDVDERLSKTNKLIEGFIEQNVRFAFGNLETRLSKTNNLIEDSMDKVLRQQARDIDILFKNGIINEIQRTEIIQILKKKDTGKTLGEIWGAK